MSPYGSSKLMTEIMLADTARAHDLRYVALRYFNVAGADPKGRSGQSTPRATHLIKVACETALGKRSHMEVFGTDYPTARRHLPARLHPRHRSRRARTWRRCAICARAAKATSSTAAMAAGFSVLRGDRRGQARRGRDFEVRMSARRPGDPARVVAASERIRKTLGWVPEHDTLDAIVRDALGWEKRLSSLQNNQSASVA